MIKEAVRLRPKLLQMKNRRWRVGLEAMSGPDKGRTALSEQEYKTEEEAETALSHWRVQQSMASHGGGAPKLAETKQEMHEHVLKATKQ